MHSLMLFISLAYGADPEQLMREGQPAQALEAARQQIRESPQDVQDHELLIDLMMNIGLGLQGEIAYLQFAQDNASDPMAWYLLGRAALDPRRANTAYAKALSLDPGYARATMGLASVQRATGHAEQAQELFEQALALDPSLAEAWSGLGAALMDQRQPQQALKVSLQAMEAVPYDIEAYLGATALDPAHALSHLEAGVAKNPQSPELRAALAKEQMFAGDYRQARINLDKALASNPSDTQALFDRAMVGELEAGRLDPAGQQALARARDLADGTPVAAELAVRDLVSAYPDCYLVFLVQAHMMMGLGRSSEALTSLGRALELAPDSPDVRGALGMLLLTAGDPKGALPHLSAAFAARPWDVELGVSVGMALAGAEGVNAGVVHLSQLADAHPTELAPVMALVTLLSQAGRPDAAYQVLSRAVDRYPHPTLLLSKAAAAQDLGREAEAATLLLELERLTGDPKYGAMAKELQP